MTTELIYADDKPKQIPLSALNATMTFEYDGAPYVRLQKPADGTQVSDDLEIACVCLSSMRFSFIYHSTLVTPTDCTITIIK